MIPSSAMQHYIEERRRRSQEDQEAAWQDSVFAARYSSPLLIIIKGAQIFIIFHRRPKN